MRISCLAVLLSIAIPAGASASGAPSLVPLPDPASAGEDIATTTDESSRLTVPVSIDGKGPFPFIVDTGAEQTLLSEELAAILGLARTGSARVHSISGTGNFATVTVPSIAVPGTPVRDMVALLAKRRDLGAEGLIGIDALKSSAVLIDFARETMSVRRSERKPQLGDDDEDQDAIVVRARTRLGRLILADAKIDGHAVAVVVDTGAEYSVGNAVLHRRIINRQGAFTQPIGLHDVMGGSVPAEVGTIRELSIGSVTLSNMPAAFANLAIFRTLGLERRPAMLLGMNSLRAFSQVFVDFAHKRVHFVLADDDKLDMTAATAPARAEDLNNY